MGSSGTKKKVEARGSSSGLKIKKKKKGSLLEGTLEAADPGVKPSTGKKKLKRKKLKSSADVVGQEASPVKKAKKKKAGREAQPRAGGNDFQDVTSLTTTKRKRTKKERKLRAT